MNKGVFKKYEGFVKVSDITAEGRTAYIDVTYSNHYTIGINTQPIDMVRFMVSINQSKNVGSLNPQLENICKEIESRKGYKKWLRIKKLNRINGVQS